MSKASGSGKTLKVNKPQRKIAQRGRPPSGLAPSKKLLLRLYAEEGKSIREIGETLNCSKDMVARAIKAYGIEAREHVRKTSLWNLSKEALEAGIKEKGLRGFARELGVNESTLRYHIQTARKPD